MYKGRRGLTGCGTLAELLARRRGVRNPHAVPPLTEKQILAWADAHFAAKGKWPNARSGAIEGTNETWQIVDSAMQNGCRGLRRGFTLPQLLAARRGARNRRRFHH